MQVEQRHLDRGKDIIEQEGIVYDDDGRVFDGSCAEGTYFEDFARQLGELNPDRTFLTTNSQDSKGDWTRAVYDNDKYEPSEIKDIISKR